MRGRAAVRYLHVRRSIAPHDWGRATALEEEFAVGGIPSTAGPVMEFPASRPRDRVVLAPRHAARQLRVDSDSQVVTARARHGCRCAG